MAEEKRRTFSEQIETTGAQLIGQVKRLLAEGNARTLRIKEPDGDVVLEINLTVGALAGGAVVLGAVAGGARGDRRARDARLGRDHLR